MLEWMGPVAQSRWGGAMLALAAVTSSLVLGCSKFEPSASVDAGLDGSATSTSDGATSSQSGDACSVESDTCGAGRYCLADTKQCAVGCKKDDDCRGNVLTPFCNVTRHQCVMCLDSKQCVAPKVCSPSGICADRCSLDAGAGAGVGACKTGEACCGEFCVDTSSDPFNCNGCGNECGGASPLCCGSQCKDALTSKTDCGECGNQCDTTNATPNCAGGSCQWMCNVGYSHCLQGNTGCETKTDSVSKCGGCNTDCNVLVKNANGITCAKTAMSVSCDYGTCKGGFIDLDGNRTNGCEAACGAAEQACCASSTCNNGLYCGGDKKCHACKPLNSSCTTTSECCSPKICQPQKVCQ